MLEIYVEENKLSAENIFKYVDSYSIYSFYIGEELEVNTKYSSPLRQGDENPSFALFFSNKGEGELLFKDHGNGISGDAIKFVAVLFQVSRKDAMSQINQDFGLGLGGKEAKDFKAKLVKTGPPLQKEILEIEITSKPWTDEFLKFWKLIGVTKKDVLQEYFVKDVRVIHYIRGKEKVSIVPKTLCISYEILGYYKIYQPYDKKEFKFRNNYPYGFVEGALQIEKYNTGNDFAIITKSSKECIFFRNHFGWDAVAGTSENTKISDFYIKKLFSRFKKVYIWLDNDEAGINAQKSYLALYPTLIPISAGKYLQKDPTDMYRDNLDKQGVLDYIKTLIT